MALTLTSLKLYTTHAIPNGPSAGLPAVGADSTVGGVIVNQAGRHLCNAHPWKFLERPPARLNFSAPISITNGTWTDATKTFTKTAAFASYTFRPGDELEITDGTGATVGFYPIASKTSSDAIVTVDSIGSSADGQTDIDAEIGFPYVALPTDFGQEIRTQATGLTEGFCMTDFATIADMRQTGLLPVGFEWYGAFVQPSQALQTAVLSAARLEIVPTPTAARVAALTLWYRAAWRELTDGAHYAAVPDWCEMLLIQYIRAFTEGYDNRYGEESAGIIISLESRLEEIERGRVFERAVERDGLLQSNYGVVSNGAAQMAESRMAMADVGSALYSDPWPQAATWIT